MKNYQVDNRILTHDYGVKLRGDHTEFSVWSPLAKKIQVCVYKSPRAIRRKVYDMADEEGIWHLTLEQNLEGQFYTYLIDGKEVIDPYVQSASGNSTKGAILSAATVNPEGFLGHLRPNPIDKLDTIIYEVHVKDFSIDHGLPFINKGKYLAFTETDLMFENHKIGIDHLVEMGVTHIHLLPVFDFITVNDYDNDAYNWGYDPYLFNCPEGSYSTEPDNPRSRVLELKQLIQSLHKAGLFVVMDVVYNHTYFGGTSNFHRLMPNVFHRFDKNGHFQNGSGCGNELDTEHPFVKKFIIDSLRFWLEVYQVDGFRFDLMGLYDTGFVKDMSESLMEIKPDILLYGEPWTGGSSGLAHDKQMLKGKQRDMNVSLFNDDFRNAIKGSNDGEDLGFIGAGKYRKSDVYAGCYGSIKFNDDILGFAKSAHESVNYVSSHDNLILIDKFSKADYHKPFEEKQNMNATALAMVILSFGIPFIQAGTEFLRSKYGDHNSYKSSAYLNRMHWSYKKDHRHVFDFVKALIEFRKSQQVFKLDNKDDIIAAVHMLEDIEGIVRYELLSPFKDDYSRILIAYNGTDKEAAFDVRDYKVHIDGALYYNDKCEIKENILYLPRYASVVLIKD
jgi:pullulanase